MVAAHTPPDLAAFFGTTFGQAVDAAVPARRSAQDTRSDSANRPNRAAAYEAFGSSVAAAWHSVSILSQFKRKKIGSFTAFFS
jgi:hypothetical protein